MTYYHRYLSCMQGLTSIPLEAGKDEPADSKCKGGSLKSQESRYRARAPNPLSENHRLTKVWVTQVETVHAIGGSTEQEDGHQPASRHKTLQRDRQVP